MTTKLVVRVLDAAGALLAWAEVWAEARGDGRLWADGTYPALVEQDGTPAWLSIHWADVNVEVRLPYDKPAVHAGETIALSWAPSHVLYVGEAAGGLPPVTVRSAVTVGVPVGTFSGAPAGAVSLMAVERR